MTKLDVPAGVIFGADVQKVFAHAKENKYAIPAVNCTSSSTILAVLEAAQKVNSPVIIQFSNGGGAFLAGKGFKSSGKPQEAAILGSIAGAKFVHAIAEHYKVPVILHSDHCAKKLLPWLDGMMEENKKMFAATGKTLFSTHMIDLSECTHEENVSICEQYLKEMHKLNITLEMEIGITGGEEDGVDNSNVDQDKLYTTNEDIELVYTRLSKISPNFTIAAAFGNVHGVYKPGNVKLRPELIGQFQKHISTKFCKGEIEKPINFVFHGGSGSSAEDIKTAVDSGVIKMNIDTDTQWAYWDGLKNFYKSKEHYLQGQIGNPDGPEKPNKAHYDPRNWVRKSEESMVARVELAFKELNCMNRLG